MSILHSVPKLLY